MQRRTLCKYALTLGGALLLSGCGFRLRGLDAPLTELTEISVAGPTSALREQLIARLESAGTAVNDTAPWVLTLGQENIEERNLGLLQAGSQQHEMTLSVSIALQRRADGAYRLPGEVLTVQERFTASDDNLLAADDYRDNIRDRLRDEASRQIIQRLRILAERQD
ncbi:MAG TPA: LPS assembly lipoprotein LptE [Halomonas sp.]|nr:LPS assembly lipoprotein LptE [Halomonas sp.]